MELLTKVCFIALLALIVQQAASAGERAGVHQITVPSKERGLDLDVTVWYPAQPGGTSVVLGESPFFEGTSARRDAPLSSGNFPIVLLSHGAGLGGTPGALSWLAVPLAEQGFIVAAPTHPGNGGTNRSAVETVKLWLRPSDISETLTVMKDVSFFKGSLDADHVGILGLSMGGGTALTIAGARMDAQRLAGYCDTDALNASFCNWLRQSRVDLHAMDLTLAGRDARDKRVRFVMAIDPAPIDVFDIRSFFRISAHVELVNLGRPNRIPHTVDASGIATIIPNARYANIDDASHYSMFGECKSGMDKDAEAEIGEAICTDGGGRSRRELHKQMIDMVVAAFTRALKASN